MTAKSGQEAFHLFVPCRHVGPDEAVVAAEQLDDVVGLVSLRPGRVHETNVHEHRVTLAALAVQKSGDGYTAYGHVRRTTLDAFPAVTSAA